MLKIISIPVYRKIVLYNPNNQNIGIAINIDIKDGKKLKFSNKISSSNLIVYANQVHKTHNPMSVIIAIIRFEYR